MEGKAARGKTAASKVNGRNGADANVPAAGSKVEQLSRTKAAPVKTEASKPQPPTQPVLLPPEPPVKTKAAPSKIAAVTSVKRPKR
jgi:hypothetical protein